MNQEQLIFQLTTFFIDFKKPLHTSCSKKPNQLVCRVRFKPLFSTHGSTQSRKTLRSCPTQPAGALGRILDQPFRSNHFFGPNAIWCWSDQFSCKLLYGFSQIDS